MLNVVFLLWMFLPALYYTQKTFDKLTAELLLLLLLVDATENIPNLWAVLTILLINNNLTTYLLLMTRNNFVRYFLKEEI